MRGDNTYKISKNITKMEKPKFIFIGGINGVGKTSIIKKFSKKQRNSSLVFGSAFFMDWLGIKKGEYEALQRVPDKKALAELNKMVTYLVKKKKFDEYISYVFIDGHFLNIRNGIAKKWVGDWFALMDGMVLVTSSPTDILKRIENDKKKKNRKRNIFPSGGGYREKIKCIVKWNKMSENIIIELGRKYHIPIKIINNKGDNISKAVDQLTNFIIKKI